MYTASKIILRAIHALCRYSEVFDYPSQNLLTVIFVVHVLWSSTCNSIRLLHNGGGCGCGYKLFITTLGMSVGVSGGVR